MISYFNFKRFNSDAYLLTNDLGDYCFLPLDDFEKLVYHRSQLSKQAVEQLTTAKMLVDGSYHHFVDANVPSGYRL